MIKLFRKIRQSFIESGSTRKYFIYALGEIALVVAGILIALQVNNWNEGRMDSLEEEKLYCTIHEQMGLFYFYHENGLDRYTGIISSAEQLLLLINDPSLIRSEAKIDEYLNALGRRWLTGAGNSTNIYDLLISTGKLELLHSMEVKENLRQLNNHLDYMSTYEELQAFFVDNRLSPYLDQYVDRISISAQRLELNESLSRSRFKTSYQKLLDDREFANLLIELIERSRALVQSYNRMGIQIATIDSVAVIKCPTVSMAVVDSEE